MAGKLLRFWNLVFFCMYKLQIGFHKVFSLINPISWFIKMPSVKRFFKRKRDIDNMSGYLDKQVFENPVAGNSITWARIHIGVLMMIVQVFIFILIQIIAKRNLFNYILDNSMYKIIFVFSLLIPGGIVDYFVFDKKDLYLKYFNEFDQIPKRRIWIYCLICLVAYLLLLALIIWSFTWLRFIP